ETVGASMGSPSSLGEEGSSLREHVPGRLASMGSPSSLGEERAASTRRRAVSRLQWGRRVHSAKRSSCDCPSSTTPDASMGSPSSLGEERNAPPRSAPWPAASMGSPSSLGEERDARYTKRRGTNPLQWGRRVHSAKSEDGRDHPRN